MNSFAHQQVNISIQKMRPFFFGGVHKAPISRVILFLGLVGKWIGFTNMHVWSKTWRIQKTHSEIGRFFLFIKHNWCVQFVPILYNCLDIFGSPGTTCISILSTKLQVGSHLLATVATLDEDENTQNKSEFWENMRSFEAKWETMRNAWENTKR